MSGFTDRAVATAKRQKIIIVDSSSSDSDSDSGSDSDSDVVVVVPDDPDTSRVRRLIERIDSAAEHAHAAAPPATRVSVDERRARRLTVGDRYGIGKPDAQRELRRRNLLTIVKEIKTEMKRLRAKLAARDDTQRVQAQRIIQGPSMLSITRCRSAAHNRPLNGLLAAAIHPVFGIPSIAVSSIDAIPLKLPIALQPKLPSLPNRTVDATAINNLLAGVFACMIDPDRCLDAEIRQFVDRFELTTAVGRLRFGGLPNVWTADVGFETVIPDVPEGSVIMWKTWHATGGSAPGLGPKLVAFMDMVPRHFLTTAEYTWYEYCTRSAPVDPGAGSSRGAWQAMVNAMAAGPTPNNDGFGIDTTDWAKVGDGAVIPAIKRHELETSGYTIVTPPAALVASAQAATSARNFEVFFKNISGYDLDLLRNEGHGSIADLFENEGTKGGTMLNRLQKINPDAPFAAAGGERSGTAQGGGAFITMTAGMGPGTTYCNEPAHVQFQTSAWAAGIMAGAGGAFYRGQLIPVWERFRLKDTAAWSANTHVDTRIDNLIPAAAVAHISRAGI